ncbi:MAG: hypothetical protein CMD57_01880 [Gammaproteobacteria bacterium]|nr:hypothetical protein [Gammaproteobacteria bacterium]
MKGHTFISAHFCNDKRTLVEALWEKDGKNVVQYIEANDNSKAWKTLLTHVDIDTLHEATYKHIREQNEVFEDLIIKIGKERGLLYDINEIDTDVYKVLAQCLFGPFDEEKDKEKLFLYKLQLFELDAIKKTKSKIKKKNLRQAKSIIEATKIAIDLCS